MTYTWSDDTIVLHKIPFNIKLLVAVWYFTVHMLRYHWIFMSTSHKPLFCNSAALIDPTITMTSFTYIDALNKVYIYIQKQIGYEHSLQIYTCMKEISFKDILVNMLYNLKCMYLWLFIFSTFIFKDFHIKLFWYVFETIL